MSSWVEKVFNLKYKFIDFNLLSTAGLKIEKNFYEKNVGFLLYLLN
jgi:hypothetical protein